ncbi:dienelactone hydrolase family protein [soil metagenome]
MAWSRWTPSSFEPYSWPVCFEHDSTPPIVAGAAVDHRDMVLTADDGNLFLAYEAYASEGGATGVLILPDVRGLFSFYKDLANRFAENGHDAVSIDYFGRTAGREPRGADFPFRDHVAQTTFDGVRLDVAAAVALLRETNKDRKIFTVGFCFGGSNSWHQAANGHGLAGVIGFYGVPGRAWPSGAPSAIDIAPEIACPVLALIGGADEGIPPEMVDDFDRALTAADVEHEIKVYENAPHSFFDRKQDEFRSESDDAWQRTLAFIAKNS